MQDRDAPTHAAGIVVRQVDGEPRYLVVTARRNPDAWVLPKGHVEPHETPEETAAREVREEAGVEARVVAQVGERAFRAKGEELRVSYYLMEFQGLTQPAERRKTAWLGREGALRRLSFQEGREMLEKAHALRQGG
jgi:8-oxo-dGTP pyrophosphatase MutT (NUDIX family)